LLTTTGKVHADRTILYIASTRDCRACPLKPKCTPNMPFRRLRRDINEDARDVAHALIDTPEFEKSRDEGKKVEMLRALEDPSPLRTHAAQGPVGRARRVSSRSDCPEPQDPCQPHLSSAAQRGSCLRYVGVCCVKVALVGLRCVKCSVVASAYRCHPIRRLR
jgi:hypothetical protein